MCAKLRKTIASYCVLSLLASNTLVEESKRARIPVVFVRFTRALSWRLRIYWTMKGLAAVHFALLLVAAHLRSTASQGCDASASRTDCGKCANARQSPLHRVLRCGASNRSACNRLIPILHKVQHKCAHVAISACFYDAVWFNSTFIMCVCVGGCQVTWASQRQSARPRIAAGHLLT